jgi:hypothetical protein
MGANGGALSQNGQVMSFSTAHSPSTVCSNGKARADVRRAPGIIQHAMGSVVLGETS